MTTSTDWKSTVALAEADCRARGMALGWTQRPAGCGCPWRGSSNTLSTSGSPARLRPMRGCLGSDGLGGVLLQHLDGRRTMGGRRRNSVVADQMLARNPLHHRW
jgi:hypothetical protein